MAAENKHVPDIERRIRVIFERCRATRHNLPFQIIPKLPTNNIVLNTVNMLNFFPMKGLISDSLIPKNIISGETLDFKNYLRLQLGNYCKVHKEDIPQNIQDPRTKGEI